MCEQAGSPPELANEFWSHATTDMKWIRQLDDASGTTPVRASALSFNKRQELIDLRSKLRQVQMECDILAKAKASFTYNGDKTYTPLAH